MWNYILKILRSISCKSSCQLDIDKKQIFKFVSNLDYDDFKSIIEIHEMKINLLKQNKFLINEEINNIIKNSLKIHNKKNYLVSEI